MKPSDNLLQIIGITIALIISAPIVLACFRMFFVFGKMDTRTEKLEAWTEKMDGTLTAFVEKVDESFTAQGTRITRIETEREMELRYGRRATDRLASINMAKEGG